MVGTDTEKARDAKLEVIENRWADWPQFQVGWWSKRRSCSCKYNGSI